jgi:small subunit ribosomal protein S1
MLQGLNVEEKKDLKTEISKENETSPVREESLKGTKLGEISDFEKSLYPSKKSSYDEDTVEDKKKPEEVSEKVSQEIQPETTETATKDESSQEEPKIEVATEIVPENLNNDDLFQQEMDNLDLDYQEGDIIKCIVRKVEKSGILVDLGYKSEGFISNAEFSNSPEVTIENTVKVDDEINVYILKLESKEGYTLLSRKRAEYELAWNSLIQAVKTKEVLSNVHVISNVQGGLVVSYEGIKGFIPASQVLRDKGQTLDQFLNETLDVAVLQVDRQRRKVIFSHKYARPKADFENTQKLLEEIEIGQVRTGKVSSIKDFGVFVDIGGIEGLVHISELSWARVSHPSELLKMGQEVKVFVLGVDKENRKISLGMKQLEPDPWVNISERFSIGQIVTGTISRIVAFGAFIKIEDNLEGLIHISELSYDHIDKVEDVVKIGEKVQAKIIKLMPDEQKIGLSLKGTTAKKEETESNTTDNEEKTEEPVKAEQKEEQVDKEPESTPETQDEEQVEEK